MTNLKKRLESLYRHLDEEGWHVHANTVALAIEDIARMRSASVILLNFAERSEFHSFGEFPKWLKDCRRDIE